MTATTLSRKAPAKKPAARKSAAPKAAKTATVEAVPVDLPVDNVVTAVEEEKTDVTAGRKTATTRYTSGFCGGSALNHVFITNSEDIHRLCPYSAATRVPCACACHKGQKPWEGRMELVADARAGRGAAKAKFKHPANAKAGRSRSSAAPETLAEARANDSEKNVG